MDETKQPGLQVSQVLLLRALFEHRADAFTLPHTTPIVDLPVQLEANAVGKPGESVAIVRVRVYTPSDIEPPLYRFDIEVAAMVNTVPGEENLEPFEWAKAHGPQMLYPFLREAVASITLKGRFGPIWLKPFNFKAANPKVEEGLVATETLAAAEPKRF